LEKISVSDEILLKKGFFCEVNVNSIDIDYRVFHRLRYSN